MAKDKDDELRVSDIIAEFDGGFLDAEASAALRQLIKQVRLSGGKHKLVLTFDVKQNPHIEDAVIVIAKQESKIQKPQPSARVYRTFSDGSVQELDDDAEVEDDDDDGLGSLSTSRDKVTPFRKPKK